MTGRWLCWMAFLAFCSLTSLVYAEPAGSIRGVVLDRDFDTPLPAVKVLIAETDQSVTTTDQGNYRFDQVSPGSYTLVFSKDGYVRYVRSGVVVSAGQMTEVNASLAGEFEEMEEFVVQDVQIGAATETALLELRMESPALMDSISSDLMSQAGASDAAGALRLVAGATVQDGKYATVRGLPDRYVNSQMNGVRLPTADADKRAVQLDQFPAAVIDSIQVSKTFTPDQQGDASGGAVNVILKGIPEAFTFSWNISTSWDSPSAGNDFLSYKGGGINKWGRDDGRRLPQLDKLNQRWDGAAGVSSAQEPTNYKWSVAVGNKWDFEDFRIGAFGSFFYDWKSSHISDKTDDVYRVLGADVQAGMPYRMTPSYRGRGSPGDDLDDFWVTSLFDVTQSARQVQWGGMGVLGLESENHNLRFTYMYTRDATDKATLAENTRGKESVYKYWPNLYPDMEGIRFDDVLPGRENTSPPVRNETLEYTERMTETYQLHGRHTLPGLEAEIADLLTLLEPEVDWTLSQNAARLYQPDKRQLSTMWVRWDETYAEHSAIRFGEGNLGNFQRIWKDIREDGDQYALNLKLPYELWNGEEGYWKVGIFNDEVARTYRQESYSNIADTINFRRGDWDDLWSRYWPQENHRIRESNFDVDYDGSQTISAWYWMADVPLNAWLKLIGGFRFERTEIQIKNNPDRDINGNVLARWYDFGWTDEGAVYVNFIQFDPAFTDVQYKQNDVLPSLSFEYKPWETMTVRGAYSETVARQTFKELSPIRQQEYLGGEIFAGNPRLQMSALKNYDLRLDWTPYQGGLFSMSYFYKDIQNPIEYVQVVGAFDRFTSAVNYPQGKLSGFEFELRQQMGRFWDSLQGIQVGANATLMDSEVSLTEGEVKAFWAKGIPISKTRDMTNAPKHLYNLFLTYDLVETGTQLGLFYTVRGDMLVAGAGLDGNNFIPSVYETEYGTLNFSWTQKLGEIWKLRFQAKNLLDPKIETVYRSTFIDRDVTKTSYRKGMEFSIGLSASF